MNKLNFKIKTLIVILITLSFSLLGIYSNKHTEPDWFSMYKVPLDSKFVPITDSMHMQYAKHKIIRKNQRPIFEFVVREIKNYNTSSLLNKFPEIKDFTMNNDHFSVLANNPAIADEKIEEIITIINNDLKKRLKEFLIFYSDLMRNKLNPEINDIKLKDEQVLVNEVRKLKLETLKKFLKEQRFENETKNELENSLYTQLTDLFLLDNFGQNLKKEMQIIINEELDQYERSKDLEALIFLENELDNLDLLVLSNLENRFNKTPTLTMSVTTFSAFGLFIGLFFILISSISFQKILKQRSSVLQNLIQMKK